MAIKLFIKVLDEDFESYKDMQVDAELLNFQIYGYSFFVHRNPGVGYDWSVSEFTTGACQGSGETIISAVKKTYKNIEGVGEEKYKSMIDSLIAQYGVCNTALPIPADKEYDQIEKELNELQRIADEIEEEGQGALAD